MTAVTVGTELPPFVAQVDDDHIRIVALILRDPNPIHFDRAAVAAAGLGDREVNQGGATLAYALNMLTAWVGSRAAVHRIDCRFTANVFAGDRVVAGGTVREVREIEDGRLADCEIWVDLADGTRALTGTATVLLGQ